MDTSFPGAPSGQHTIPSHSGEQKPSEETKAEVTEPACLYQALNDCRPLQEQRAVCLLLSFKRRPSV